MLCASRRHICVLSVRSDIADGASGGQTSQIRAQNAPGRNLSRRIAHSKSTKKPRASVQRFCAAACGRLADGLRTACGRLADGLPTAPRGPKALQCAPGSSKYQCESNVSPMRVQCESNASSMRVQCESNASPMRVQCEFNASSTRAQRELDACSMRAQCELNASSMRVQCEFNPWDSLERLGAPWSSLGGGGLWRAVRSVAQKWVPGSFEVVFGPTMVTTQGAAWHPRIPGK